MTKASKSPRRDPERTRARILASATEAFAEHGFACATGEGINSSAGISMRMLYHYFDDKAGLYVAVLEHLLGELRLSEHQPVSPDATGIDGLLEIFDRIFTHFGESPALVRILSTENIMSAHFLKSSISTPRVASPSLRNITMLLERGQRDGTVHAEIDPLHLYVVMVGLAFFHRSNGHTLSHIWSTDILSASWQQEHRQIGRRILKEFLSSRSSGEA